MAKTIAQLTDATTVNAADELIISQGGITKRATGAELAAGLNTINGTVNVKDFGASPLASASVNLTAIQTAINTLASLGGGEVYIPNGDYNIDAAITLPFNVSLRGTGIRSTLLRQNTLNVPVIHLNNGNCHIKDIGVIFAGAPTSGADAILVSNADNFIHNVCVYNGWNGIKYTAGGQKASAITIKDCSNTGLMFSGCNDVYVSNFLITTATASNFSNGGIRLENKAEAIFVSNGSVLGGAYSLVTGASVYDFNIRPAFCSFASVYFDSASNGSFIDKMFICKFVGCWFSGGRSGFGAPGMTLGQSSDVVFDACEFFNCGTHGAIVYSTAVGARFKQCLFADNNVSNSILGGRGILIQANTSDFIIQGCRATNGLYPSGDQSVGIVIDTGTSDRYVVADNLVSGNSSSGVFDGGSGVNKRVANNY